MRLQKLINNDLEGMTHRVNTLFYGMTIKKYFQLKSILYYMGSPLKEMNCQ